jgi:putative copper export protein
LLIGGLTISFLTGIPLFMSESIKAYYSFAFWVKMTSLLLVLIFTFTIRRRVTRTNLTADRPALGRWMAVLSLSLWFGVAWGGRWIGFS